MNDHAAHPGRLPETDDRGWVVHCADGVERHAQRFGSILLAEHWAAACSACAGPHRIVDPDSTEIDLATRWTP